MSSSYKPAWQIHENRTRGLQTKVIQDAVSTDVCKTCNGSGKYNINIPSTSFRNLSGKGLGKFVTLENDCTNCVNGVVKTKMRVVRKANGPVAIV